MDGLSVTPQAAARSIVNQPPYRLGLIRPRLLARLDRSKSGGLALVVAPAGFGKTTLLAQYARRHLGPVAWLAIDAADAAEARMGSLIAAAISAATRPADPAGTHPLGPDGPRITSFPDGPQIARDALRAAPRDLLLIIDNADALLDTPNEKLLEELLSATPDGVYVLLAGRQLTATDLLRHEVAGYFDVIGADQLRFRTWEVERLLADVYAEPLQPDDVAVLTRRTGGWVAGLAMFHLATRGRPVRARQQAVAALSDRWDLTRGYLARTVLAELSPDVRQFLVRTSVFDSVTPIRCDRLLARTGSGRVLEGLTNHHALPVTSDAGAYQYHQVLRSHLLAALVDDLGERAARDWHARAANLLTDEGAYAEAARSFARAGDWRAVGALLPTLGAEVAGHREQPLADLLPAWLLAEDPWLVYAEARRRLADGQLEAALDGLRRAETLFGDDAGRVCRVDRRIATIWMPGRQLARTHWAAWLRAATQRHPAAIAGEAMTLTGPEGELIRLLAEFLSGNLAEALRRAARPLTISWPDSSVAGLALLIARAGLRLMRDTDAAERERRALDLVQLADEADEAGVPWLNRLARAACGLSGDPVLAAEAVAVANECERRGDRWGAALAHAVTSVHDWRQGRLDHTAATQLLAHCRDLDAGVLQTWAQVLVALTAAAQGLPDAEVEARAAANLASSAGVPGAHAAATVALAHLYPGRAAQLLAEAGIQAAAAGVPPDTVRSWAGVRRTTAGGAASAVVTAERTRSGSTSAPVDGVTTVAAVDAATGRLTPWLNVTCFGGFRMKIHGRTVDLLEVRPRARSALRLLATHAGQTVHREVLTAELWPDLSPRAATRNLQVTISALRGLLDRACGPGRPSLLVRSGSAYGLALPDGAHSDTAVFQAAVARWRRVRCGVDRAAEVAALREALGAYGGELFPEEGPADWAVKAREQFHRQASELSRALAIAELARGEIAEAITAAEHCISLDGFDDAAWRVLVEAYQRAGAPAKAAEVRRRYADMLAGLGLSTDGLVLHGEALQDLR